MTSPEFESSFYLRCHILLLQDLEVADEEYNGVKQENQALLRALASLAVDC